MPFRFRSLAVLAAALLGVISASACRDTPESVEPDTFRVGLLTPGSIRDAGWNQGAYEGLLRIRDELGAQVAHQQTSTPQEFEAGFRDFAARGYDLIFGHGFEFQDAAKLVGAEFPAVVFVTTSGSTVSANVAPIVFELEQATYVLGFTGARLSRTGRLGAVGGVEIPSVASTFHAFEQGALAARPDATVSVSYTGSWTDVAAAREATLAQIAQGADLLIHNANEGARGFFQAAADSPDVLAFGTNRNQNDQAPDRVLASATLDVPEALVQVAREVRDGEFRGRMLRFGLADGVVGVEWNDALAHRIDGDLRSEVDAVVAEIRSGALVVPRGDF